MTMTKSQAKTLAKLIELGGTVDTRWAVKGVHIASLWKLEQMGFVSTIVDENAVGQYSTGGTAMTTVTPAGHAAAAAI